MQIGCLPHPPGGRIRREIRQRVPERQTGAPQRERQGVARAQHGNVSALSIPISMSLTLESIRQVAMQTSRT